MFIEENHISVVKLKKKACALAEHHLDTRHEINFSDAHILFVQRNYNKGYFRDGSHYSG